MNPIVVYKRADVDGGTGGDEHEVILVAIAVGEVAAKNRAGACLKRKEGGGGWGCKRIAWERGVYLECEQKCKHDTFQRR